MLILLSPAKSLDLDSPLPDGLAQTQPPFLAQSAELIGLLRRLSPQQVASLMHLSDALAALNVARYAAWTPEGAPGSARPAVLTFNGDVYEGLDARSLDRASLAWAQEHVAILSGLYGVLRPLDGMQPYRLEMGTKLATPAGANLYQFWGERIARHLNARLAGQAAPAVLNLASQEYFKAVDRKVLAARVVECVFEDYKNGAWKIISFHAKRARGLMARHAIAQRARTPEDVLGFDAEGWRHAPAASTPERLVFRRRLA
ncbi:peroxide stress protein YaaA [Comamonas granuli]|uniref:peroxide stress protein YaaA n=1 Tax=Comamonas granuli TaxID=290309 RepID=UPI0005A6EB9C|nr:peroxide stress protein YaaA [Comamonas granuli]